MKRLMLKERPRAKRKAPMKNRPWIQRQEQDPKYSAEAQRRRTQFDNEEVPMFESKADVRPAAGPSVTFNHISADRWAAIFGSPEEIAARRRQAIQEQAQRETVSAASLAPCVIGDSQYEGYDPGLRTFIGGKADRREQMKRRDVRCVYD